MSEEYCRVMPLRATRIRNRVNDDADKNDVLTFDLESSRDNEAAPTVRRPRSLVYSEFAQHRPPSLVTPLDFSLLVRESDLRIIVGRRDTAVRGVILCGS